MALSRTLTAIALLLPLLVGPSPTASASAPDRASAAGGPVTRHTVTYEGTRYRLRLQPVGLRAPQFGVFEQQPDGRLARVRVAPTRAFLGSVEGVARRWSPRSAAATARSRGRSSSTAGPRSSSRAAR